MSEVIGVVGGMGSYASVYVLHKLLDLSDKHKDQDFPEVVIHNNTKIPDRTNHILLEQESPIMELNRSVRMLEKMGATSIIIGCITAHYYIDYLQKENQNVKIINIIEYAVDYIENECKDIEKIGVICTRGLAKVGIWQSAFNKTGKEIIYLSEVDQTECFDNAIYGVEGQNGIKAGDFSESNRERILNGVEKLKKNGAEVVLGSCSELGLVTSTSHDKSYIDVIELALERVVSNL